MLTSDSMPLPAMSETSIGRPVTAELRRRAIERARHLCNSYGRRAIDAVTDDLFARRRLPMPMSPRSSASGIMLFSTSIARAIRR
jgi:hypothetical protein